MQADAHGRTRVLFIFRNSFQKRLLGDIHAGEAVPADFLYGMNEIDGTRFDVSSVVAPRGPRRTLAAWLGWLVERPLARILGVGVPLEIYPLFRRQIRGTDVVFCANDAVSVAVLIWKKLGFVRAEVVVLLHGLAELLKDIKHRGALERFVGSLLAQAGAVLTLSDAAANALAQRFGVSRSRMKTVRFGIDRDFWKPLDAAVSGEYVLSIGNDFNRDYDTLIEAVPSDRELVVVTRRPLAPRSTRLRQLNGLSDLEVLALYQHARYVVIPNVKLANQSAGISCCFQAIACGKVLIVADSPALREVMTEGVHCYYYEPESPESLKVVLAQVERNLDQAADIGRRASDHVREHHTTATMGSDVTACLRQLTQHGRA